MKSLLFCIVSILLIGLSFYLGSMWSYDRTRAIVYQSEYKVNKYNLETVLENPDASKELVDFLKVRHYFLVSWIPDDWLTEEDDYGPSDLDNVKRLGAGKESGNDLNNYVRLQERLRRPPD